MVDDIHPEKLIRTYKMKKAFLLYVLFFCLYYVNGQNSNAINIGKIDTITSKILKEQRQLWIYVPEGYTKSIFKNKKYPVVYLLDGDAHFYSVVGMIRQLSTVNGNTVCPKMIVVGIPNTNRMRDLSPTKSSSKSSYSNSRMIEETGGGDQFISFIENELIPYIDSNYATESYRMFIGHSLGGLTVMNTLVHKPELFNSYVAIDPSMWWNNNNLLHKIKTIKFDKRYKNKSLFLGIANTMNKGMDIVNVRKDTTKSTRHIRAILELKSILENDSLNNLSFKGLYYKDDTHGSVPLIAEYDALRYIFDFYQIKINNKDLMDPNYDILGKVKAYYTRLSKEFGRDIKPELYYISNLGYKCMKLKQFEKAEQFFKYNVANYPEHSYVYDTIGDLYVAIGNKEKAIENFKKSLSLNKSSYAKEKLEKLENE